MRLRLLGAAALAVLLSCNARTNLASDDGGAATFADANPAAPDAGPNLGCQPGGVQCNNCVDDDGDTLIDGFDPECTSILDDREDSFATGIPGDNVDGTKQDCFYDGDSGAGNDGCDLHVCCLLDICPPNLPGPKFDPSQCTVTQECIDNCSPLTPPGCDCFGCCTICNGAGCFDVFTNPAVAPDCQAEYADDPSKCPRCTKSTQCGGGGCNPLECVLCPGQTPDDLPPSCTGTQCPAGVTPCVTTADCLEMQFCAAGCCIGAIQ